MPQNDRKADSLMNQSENKKIFARQQERVAKADISEGRRYSSFKYKKADGTVITIPTAEERLKMAKKARQSATSDSLAAERLKAMKK